MRSLYEISKSLLSIKQYLEEEEFTEETEKILAITKKELKVKTANYLDYIDYQLKEIMRADEAIQQIKEFKDRKKRAIARLESNLINAVNNFGPLEVDFKKVTVRTSKATNILNDAKIPKEYIREKVSYSIDRAQILKDLKEGKEIPGAILEERKNLSIK